MSANDFVISRNTKDDTYGVWRFDPLAEQVLAPVKLRSSASFDRKNSLAPIGGYMLQWGPAQEQDKANPFFKYRLFQFDPESDDPLSGKSVQQGEWQKSKFWGRGADFGNPHGGHMQFERDNTLHLIPLGSFVLNFIPTSGRGTFALWNFDPASSAPGTADPLPGNYPYTPQGSFRSIQAGHDLIPLNGYVLDRNRKTGAYALWSFDPREKIPLAHPAIQQGTWSHIGEERELVPIGDHILDWSPADRSFRIWKFDSEGKDPLCGPVSQGTLPEAITPHSTLLGVQPMIPIDEEKAKTPGTIDFMRKKIKHVVYYMIENRSFDHVCGWLYENGEAGVRVIGPSGPFNGARKDHFNLNGDKKVFQNKYKGGKLSTDYSLEMFQFDPYHDNSDVLRQLFFENENGYEERAQPDMGGFVWNNGTPEVMQTYSPEQLPVLNGLAKNFAVSDEWFCSLPSDTDTNRAFSLTGSSMGQLNNFMSPPEYDYWHQEQHRPSIWKILWANGFTGWKMYNSTLWHKYVFSYHLYLEGQIPTVDKNQSAYIQDVDKFYDDAKHGTLPAFSFLEPIWIAKSGTTSYHPGEDVVAGECQLNKIYNALREGPNWNETLLVVTFDEHGGIYDHVPPPYAKNPWPNDDRDGFRFDIMGPRIPTILVSPLIDEKIVFRSTTDVKYDATSFLATLLHWAGIPKSKWFLGERTHHAPTFEGVLDRSEPRKDSPTLTPPYDKQYPPDGPPQPSTKVTELHRVIAHRMINSTTRGKLSSQEITQLSIEADKAPDLPTLARILEKIEQDFS